MAGTISSRTPEGTPNNCPVCGSIICLEPSLPTGDAPCPNCGTLLYFFATSYGIRCHESQKVYPLLEKIAAICAELGIDKDRITPATPLSSISPETLFTKETGDSLDIVELVMLLEESFEVTIPDDEAETIKTLGDLLDYLARHGHWQR